MMPMTSISRASSLLLLELRVPPIDALWSHYRGTHVDLDVEVRSELDGPRIAEIADTVDEDDHLAGHTSDACRSQWLAPEVEELTERVGARCWRFDMNHAVLGVDVEPVITIRRRVEGSVHRRLGNRCHDPDARRQWAESSIDVDTEMHVHVIRDLLGRVTCDFIDGGSVRGRRFGSEQFADLEWNTLRPGRTCDRTRRHVGVRW